MRTEVTRRGKKAVTGESERDEQDFSAKDGGDTTHAI
jgi:hypothetical protein